MKDSHAAQNDLVLLHGVTIGPEFCGVHGSCALGTYVATIETREKLLIDLFCHDYTRLLRCHAGVA